VSEITVSDLQIMQQAGRYRRWCFDQVSPWVGRRVLEIGAGIGNQTEFLLGSEVVVCVELCREAAAVLRGRYAGQPRVVVFEGDICSESARSLAEHACDTAICFNVLEHIEDDVEGLRNIARILVPGARLLLMVPALPAIFGTVDRSLGHWRRYLPSTLRAALEKAGYRLERLWWMNLPGILGWFVNNRILRRKEESMGQILLFDRLLVPVTRFFESLVHPPVGLSLIAIAQSGRSDEVCSTDSLAGPTRSPAAP